MIFRDHRDRVGRGPSARPPPLPPPSPPLPPPSPPPLSPSPPPLPPSPPSPFSCGEYFAENGATKVICVNTVPGAANLEARCKGVIDGMTAAGGAAEQLPLPPTAFGNPTAVAEAIKAQLLKDPSVDGIITISQATPTAPRTGSCRPARRGGSSLAGST